MQIQSQLPTLKSEANKKLNLELEQLRLEKATELREAELLSGNLKAHIKELKEGHAGILQGMNITHQTEIAKWEGKLKVEITTVIIILNGYQSFLSQIISIH